MRATLFVLLLGGCGSGPARSDAGPDGGRPCTVTLSGDVSASLACTVAAGSVGFQIDTMATSTQPLRVTIPCDTPSEVKVGTLGPPSCQALVIEAGTGRSWAHTADLRVDITAVESPRVGVIEIAGTATGTLRTTLADGGSAGNVVLRASF